QGDGERRVGVTPGDDQHRDLPPAVGKVDVDVSEVGLGAGPRPMLQRDKRLAAVDSFLLEVAANLIVLAGVAFLSDQAAVDLCGSMPLLAWSRLIGDDYLIHEIAKRPKHRGLPGYRWTDRDGFGALQCLENGLGRMVQLIGNLADSQAVATQLT